MQVIRQRYWVNPEEEPPELGWRPIDPYCIQDDGTWNLILRTRSNSNNWHLHRMRLYSPTSDTLVQARSSDGDIIDTSVYSTTNNFEHTFGFDLSFNTNHDEIDIYIQGVPDNADFTQLYAINQFSGRYDGVALQVAEISYINMNFMLLGGSQSYVFLRNQITANNPSIELSGAGQFSGVQFDVRNNNLAPDVIDKIIIGYDQSGKINGILNLSGNQGRTSLSDIAYNSLISKGCNIDI